MSTSAEDQPPAKKKQTQESNPSQSSGQGSTKNKAQPITGSSSSTTASPTPTTTTTQQQVATPSGPKQNTGGTVQGEAGNPQIQKQPKRHFGEIQVNMNAEGLIFVYAEEDDTENCIYVVENIYPTSDVYNFRHEFECKEKHGKLDCYMNDVGYIVRNRLQFHILFTTLKSKFGGVIFENSVAFYYQNIPECLPYFNKGQLPDDDNALKNAISKHVSCK